MINAIDKSNKKNISFGQNRTKKYTPFQIKQMTDMKKAAIRLGWRDIYTGDVFSATNLPTIEHIIPCSQEQSSKVKELKTKGFQINGLDNIFPADGIENARRGSLPFKTAVIKQPEILDRLLQELDKYAKYSSEFIKGKDWVMRLRTTLISELHGLCSDISTRKLIIR